LNLLLDTHLLLWAASEPQRLSAKAQALLLVNGYRELPVTSEHTVALIDLPPLHKDPFDRILIAQARVEGLTLLTEDKALAKYGEGVKRV
jgi:PIN domain nuclease of toxin-antitoxin system